MVLIIFLIIVTAVMGRPNIILILTDDQDVVLGSLAPLSKSLSYISNSAVFTNAFATTPVCCPSRSSILTGNYLRTHRTSNNSFNGGCSGKFWQEHWEPLTFNNILHQNNYRTFYTGKYLNEYGFKRAGGVEHIPVGWDWWIGLVGNSVYYNYTLSINGSAKVYGDKNEDYLTDVLKNWASEFLRISSSKPFLMVVSPPAAHDPFTPAEKFKNYYDGLSAPRLPNFNKGSQKKHWIIRQKPEKIPKAVIKKIDKTHQNRWETLLSVDELISTIYQQLIVMNITNNTYFIITSDHGFHLGQFGQVWDKRQPYEADIRIPLIVSGPGVSKKVIFNPVLTIDIAPTIMDIAGISQLLVPTDGTSFKQLLSEKKPIFDRTFEIEYRGEHGANSCWADENVKLCSAELACKCFDALNNTYNCVRRLSNTQNSLFCKFQDDENFVEEYDMFKDPYQLENLAIVKKSLYIRSFNSNNKPTAAAFPRAN